MNDEESAIDEYHSYLSDASSTKSTFRRKGLKSILSLTTKLMEENKFFKVVQHDNEKFSWEVYIKKLANSFIHELKHQNSQKRPNNDFFTYFRDFIVLILSNDKVGNFEQQFIHYLVKLGLKIFGKCEKKLYLDVSSRFCDIIRQIVIHNVYRNYIKIDKFFSLIQSLFNILLLFDNGTKTRFAWCLQNLIHNYQKISILTYSNVVAILREYEKFFKQNLNTAINTPVLNSFNKFINIIGINYISTIRRISRGILLIKKWKTCHNDDMKMEILKFYIFQCKLQYDGDEIPYDNFAHLEKIYDHIIYAIEGNDMDSMFRNVSNEKEECFYELASEVMILMELKRRVKEAKHENKKKKRKIEDVKDVFCRKIVSNEHYEKWIKVLLYVSNKIEKEKKFPLSYFSNALVRVIEGTKKIDVKKMIMKIFENYFNFKEAKKRERTVKKIIPILMENIARERKYILNETYSLINSILHNTNYRVNIETILSSDSFSKSSDCTREKLILLNTILLKSENRYITKKDFIEHLYCAIFRGDIDYDLLRILTVNLLTETQFHDYKSGRSGNSHSFDQNRIKCVSDPFNILYTPGIIPSPTRPFSNVDDVFDRIVLEKNLKLDEDAVGEYLSVLITVCESLSREKSSDFYGKFSLLNLLNFCRYHLDILNIFLNCNIDADFREQLGRNFDKVFKKLSDIIKSKSSSSNDWVECIIDYLCIVLRRVDGTKIIINVITKKMITLFQKTIDCEELTLDSQSQHSKTESEFMDDDEEIEKMDISERIKILLKLFKILPICYKKCLVPSMQKDIQTKLVNSLNVFGENISLCFKACLALCDIGEKVSLNAVIQYLNLQNKKKGSFLKKYGDDELRCNFLEILRRMYIQFQKRFLGDEYNKCLKLLKNFTKKESWKDVNANSSTKIQLIKCIVECFMIDSSQALTDDDEDDDEGFGFIMEVFFVLLPNDNDYFVRIISGQNIHYGVRHIGDKEKMYNVLVNSNNVLSFQRKNNDDDLKQRSDIVCLCFVIINCPEFEVVGVFKLMDLVRDEYEEEDFVEDSLDMIAKKRGFDGCSSLLDEFFPYMLYKWLKAGDRHDPEKKYAISKFPYKILDCATAKEFVVEYGDDIIPLVYVDFQSRLKAVKILLQVNDEKNVLGRYFAPNYVYLLLRNTKDNRSTNIEDKRKKAIKKYLERIIFEIFNRCDPVSMNPKAPFFSKKVILGTLNVLCKSFKLQNIIALFKCKPIIILHFIVNLHAKAEKSIVFKKRYIDIFLWIIEILGKELRPVYILRSCIHFAYRMFFYKSVYSDAVKLMKKIISTLILKESSAEELFRKYIKKIIAKLISVASEVCKEGNNKVLMNEIYSILKILFSDDFESIQQVYPSEEESNEMERIFKDQNYKKEEIIEVEDNINILVDSVLRLDDYFKLSTIHSLLKRDPKLVKSIVDKEKLSKFNNKLLNLCRSHNIDSKVKADAKKCILVLGVNVLSTYNEDFDSFTEFEFQTFSNFFQNFPKNRTETRRLFQHHNTVEILFILNEYFTDNSIEVVEITLSVLRNMLYQSKSTFTKEKISSNEYFNPFKNLSSLCNKYDNMEIREPPYSPLLWNITDHENWVKKVSFSLLKYIYKAEVKNVLFRLCAPMCLKKHQFAELMFTVVVYMIVCEKEGKSGNDIAKISNLCKSILESDDSNPRTVRLILSTLVAIHKRTRLKLKYGKPGTYSPKYDYVLEIPYMSAVKAALRAKAYIAGFYFIEMHCETERLLKKIPTDLKYEEEIEDWQQCLIEIYKNITEPDGLYGVNYYYGTNSKLVRYEHEYNWSKALGTFDNILYRSKDPYAVDSFGGFLSSLQNVDDKFLLSTFINKIPKNLLDSSRELQEKYYETAWRLGDNVKYVPAKSFGGFNETLYKCLSFLKRGDITQFNALISNAKRKINFNTTTKLSSEILKIQMLSDIEETFEHKWGKNGEKRISISSSSGGGGDNDIVMNEQIKFINDQKGSIIFDQPFEDVEKLLVLRTNLLKILNRNDDMKKHMCVIADFCRKESRNDLALNVIHELSTYFKRSEIPTYLFVEAKIFWNEQKNEYPINVLQFLLKELLKGKIDNNNNSSTSDNKNSMLIANVYLTLGKWLGHSKSAEYEEIKQYFKDGINNSSFSNKSLSKAYYKYAKYLDGLYTSSSKHMESLEYKTNRIIEERNIEELKKIREYFSKVKKKNKKKKGRTRRSNKNENVVKDPNYDAMVKRYKSLEKIIKREKQMKKDFDESHLKYCHSAMKHYINTLITERDRSKYDIYTVFRICSIWFSSKNFLDKKINKMIKIGIIEKKNFPYFKFIPLIYQIASRMGKNPIIENLLVKISIKHPYHTLYQIFALKNGDRVVDRRGRSVKRDKGGFDESKIEAAKRILDKLRIESNFLDETIKQINKIVEAYHELAYFPIDKVVARSTTNFVIDESLKIKKIFNLNRVPITTRELNVRQDCNYISNIECYIKEFDKNFHTCGGINLPKVIHCITSNGDRDRQLVKGNDDMRQDAVMQQIFKLVNILLRANKHTGKRNLKIRTYEVIPLSPKTGVVGWCVGTCPLAHYLTGTDHKSGAHPKYRPKDVNNQILRLKYNKVMLDKTMQQRISFFKNTCLKKFKPVFHNFFLENGEDPNKWFQKKLNYTRSVATNSMVGYILGIGDRHPSNILVDKENAEVVHIDLGISFDQGRLLKIPELVPFRLTRDIEDGFGVQGRNGIFRRCSIETMKVLRENSDLLITILEVFIHDPLYNWTLSADKILNLQTDEDNEGGGLNFNDESRTSSSEGKNNIINRDAERCLLKLKDKLNGSCGSEFLSVSGQVNMLINEATDESNLALMFSGWASWV